MKYFHKTGPASAGIAFGSSPHCAALAVGMFFTFLGQAEATIPKIINAASPSLVDVTTAIASAVDGDTVIVPAGTASWTGTLTITKGVSIIGATTVIDPVAGTYSDQTIILDNESRPVNGGSNPIVILKPPVGKVCRVSGFTFKAVSVTGQNYNGAIVLNGPQSTSIRLDHCHVTTLHQSVIIGVASACFGVVDHNIFDFTSGQQGLFVCRMGNWVSAAGTGAVGNYGDGSFVDPPFFGSEKFIFFEDNRINNVSGTELAGCTDG